MTPKIIAFDWGHTVMDECRGRELPLEERPIHLMPGVSDVLPRLAQPLALWANTRAAAETDVRHWLERAGLNHLFGWVMTSVDAGVRKPAARFFASALEQCGATKDEVLFIGNQLNTDVAGGRAAGITTVWLSGAQYRSVDDTPSGATPSYSIATLYDLPAFLQQLQP